MSGLRDYIIEDAQGRPRYFESRGGGEFPGGEVGGRGAAAPDRSSLLDIRLATWLEQAVNLADVSGVLEAFARTYRPYAIGRTGIVVSDTAGAVSGPIVEPVPGGMYFVAVGLGLAHTSAIAPGDDFTIQITQLGSRSLFQTPMHVDQFNVSDQATGFYYPLPRRKVFLPNDSVQFDFTNREGALLHIDVMLTGFLVALATR